jgi:uncharacterized membrane protein HdeD (DUF308 family)
MTQVGKKRQSKTLIWTGLAIWLVSAVLYALNDGPFKATPLQVTAVIGFALFVFGCVQAWRRRERPAGD